MAEYELRSPSYEIDEGEVVEFYYDRGWSDGLPVVPPTTVIARSWGVPGYKFLSLLHPIANLTEWELDQRARDIVPKVVRLLTK